MADWILPAATAAGTITATYLCCVRPMLRSQGRTATRRLGAHEPGAAHNVNDGLGTAVPDQIPQPVPPQGADRSSTT
ncbi:MAG: hypothetical protein M3137_01015 [Actinomycetota bacterium]|nr:hypothetical protein [Actinomycetota bacterium]